MNKQNFQAMKQEWITGEVAVGQHEGVRGRGGGSRGAAGGGVRGRTAA